MERFVIIVNDFQPLIIITKRSILDVAVVLDPPLITLEKAEKEQKEFKSEINKIVVGSKKSEDQKILIKKY